MKNCQIGRKSLIWFTDTNLIKILKLIIMKAINFFKENFGFFALGFIVVTILTVVVTVLVTGNLAYFK